jgi:hypothetical protein
MNHFSLLSGLEWARHVHSDPFDLEWKNCAMNIRENKREKVEYNTHGLDWDSGNGLEGCSPLCYGYIDSEMIIKHVIITNVAILVAIVAL